MAHNSLNNLAKETGEVARGLQAFERRLVQQSIALSTSIDKLYEVSDLARKLAAASQLHQYQLSFYRVEQELAAVCRSAQATCMLARNTLGRTASLSFDRTWNDMKHHMNQVEGTSLQGRLTLYCDLLMCCVAELKELDNPNRRQLFTAVVMLLQRQEAIRARTAQAAIRDGYRHIPMPASPSVASDEIPPGWRPPVPEAPEPLSPTFSNSTDRTRSSSQTSYTIHNMSRHWALSVQDTSYDMTKFRSSQQRDDRTYCDFPATPDALDMLHRDGYIRVAQYSFDNNAAYVRLYHRPDTDRARILFISGRTTVHCSPLAHLKAIRDKSCIKLCRVYVEDGRVKLRQWANLNFYSFERMCLFYSTFVGMKRQDKHDDMRLPDALLEDNELDEIERFGGMIRDGNMIHALKLNEDQGSGVVRLEASPLRGERAGVPIWTAFVTKYCKDGDVEWAGHEGRGLVTLMCLQRQPYMFVNGYVPPSRNRECLLQFTTEDDAKEFCIAWTELCRSKAR